MLPVIHIGPWQFATYNLIVAVAATIGGVYAYDRLLHLSYPPGLIARWLLITVVGVIATAMLASLTTTLYRYAHSGPLAPPEGMSVF